MWTGIPPKRTLFKQWVIPNNDRFIYLFIYLMLTHIHKIQVIIQNIMAVQRVRRLIMSTIQIFIFKKLFTK